MYRKWESIYRPSGKRPDAGYRLLVLRTTGFGLETWPMGRGWHGALKESLQKIMPGLLDDYLIEMEQGLWDFR